MIQVAPSTSFDDIFPLGVSGLVGTIKFGIYQGDTVVQALSTANINEIAALGGYVATRTSPATGGFYQFAWSKDGSTDPDQMFFSDLYVTSDAESVTIGSGNLYVTSAELKATLSLDGTTFANDDIALACSAASRAIDGYKGQRFYPTTDTREFTGDRNDDWIDIGPVVSVSSVTVDEDGSGAYGTSWVAATDFALDPPNAADDGIPYRRLLLLRNAGRRFPCYANSVRVTGSFGWPEAPPQVAQAARILAGRLLKRARETPYGILTVTGDAVTAARLGRIDPDVAFLLDNLPGARTPLMV